MDKWNGIDIVVGSKSPTEQWFESWSGLDRSMLQVLGAQSESSFGDASTRRFLGEVSSRKSAV
eukprot:3945524-Pleurochrysis_carterae.AAC.1